MYTLTYNTRFYKSHTVTVTFDIIADVVAYVRDIDTHAPAEFTTDAAVPTTYMPAYDFTVNGIPAGCDLTTVRRVLYTGTPTPH